MAQRQFGERVDKESEGMFYVRNEHQLSGHSPKEYFILEEKCVKSSFGEQFRFAEEQIEKYVANLLEIYGLCES